MWWRYLALASILCLALVIANPNPNYGCEKDAYPPQQKYALPWYKLDLNKDPLHRWDDIIEVYKDQINALLDQAVHLVEIIDPSGKIIEFVDKYFPLLLYKVPREYRFVSFCLLKYVMS